MYAASTIHTHPMFLLFSPDQSQVNNLFPMLCSKAVLSMPLSFLLGQKEERKREEEKEGKGERKRVVLKRAPLYEAGSLLLLSSSSS